MLKCVTLALPRQINNPGCFQLAQRLPTTHLAQLTVGRQPFQPLTHPPGQFKPRNRRFFTNRLLNPIQHRAGKMLTTNIHDPYIAFRTPCVKCVLRPALDGGGRGGGDFHPSLCPPRAWELLSYKGMFPCLRQGLVSTLFFKESRAWIILGRVSSGKIISSTYPNAAAL